jgi:hypothetical protein
MPQDRAIAIVDLFAGPGGLGEGFVSLTAKEHQLDSRIVWRQAADDPPRTVGALLNAWHTSGENCIRQ